MKKHLSISLLLGFLIVQTAFPQTKDHLKLSDPYPSAGEKITFTYDPAGTPVDGKSDLNAVVYFIDNKNYPAADINLKPDGKLLKGDFTIPDSAKAFFVKIGKDDTVDDNNGQGYLYLIYKDKKPVAGAYASKAQLYYPSGLSSYYAKIKKDIDKAFNLFKDEFKLYPQSKKEYESDYVDLLALGNTPEMHYELNNKLKKLSASNNEKELIQAISILRGIKKMTQADSLRTVLNAKFPNNGFGGNALLNSFVSEKGLGKKDSIYKEFIRKYPSDATVKETPEDLMRIQLAQMYLANFDLANFNQVKIKIKNKINLSFVMNGAAYDWAKNGEHLNNAAELSKLSLAIITKNMANPIAQPYTSPKKLKKDNALSYNIFANTYAFILYKQGKFKEALSYEQPVYEHKKGNDAEINENYALMLKAAREEQKARTVIENAIKNGKSSESMNAALKAIYTKPKGSDAGYDQYFANLKNASTIAMRATLAKEMINLPAPLFTLKDTSGKAVSLAELKGKVIVIDFWATWCGPCKESFPGMQLAVNKYKNDPNVQFLFIDTWETDKDYLTGVKKFITDNHYSFDVLMDEKGEDGRQSKVVSQFKVEGIPTKFILDKNGNIRFKHVGFEGTAESLREEVSAMIEMAAGADLPKSEKVSMVN